MTSKRHGRTTCPHCGKALDNGQPLTDVTAPTTVYRQDSVQFRKYVGGDTPLPWHAKCLADAEAGEWERTIRRTQEAIDEYVKDVTELGGDINSDRSRNVLARFAATITEAQDKLAGLLAS
jgi:hypothetical protein